MVSECEVLSWAGRRGPFPHFCFKQRLLVVDRNFHTEVLLSCEHWDAGDKRMKTFRVESKGPTEEKHMGGEENNLIVLKQMRM